MTLKWCGSMFGFYKLLIVKPWQITEKIIWFENVNDTNEYSLVAFTQLYAISKHVGVSVDAWLGDVLCLVGG